jgi:PAS domain S-box-containing protein
MKRASVPLLTLLAGLVATVGATWFVANYFEVKTRAEFNDTVSVIAEDIQARVEAYIALLRGCSGLFAVRRQVTSGEFHAFVSRLRVQDDYPGVQGIGYAQRVRPSEREAFIARLRGQGAASFAIWPEGERDEFFPIAYLEPEDRRNRAAIGYDMFSDPVRRAAMESARDTGNPVASSKVTLVQEIEGPPQAGFLIYVPVYREGDIPPTVAERRAAIQGFAYSPFRADDLFREILSPPSGVVALRVYDAPGSSESQLLHRSSGEALRSEGRFHSTRRVEVAGHAWLLRIDSQSAFDTRAHGGRIPLLIFLTGVLVSLLLYYFTNAEAKARYAAEQSAERLKRSREALRQSEERLRLVVDSARDYAIMAVDTGGTILSANAGAEQLYGYPPSELVGRDFSVLFTPEERAAQLPQREMARCLETGRAEVDRWTATRTGEPRFVTGVARAIRDEFGHVHGFIKVTRDITIRRQTEEQVRKEKEFTDAIVQSLPGIFYVFNREGRFIYWNRMFEQITGYSGPEISEMKLTTFLAEEHREFMTGRFKEAFEHGQTSAEADVRHKSGERTPYYFTGRRVELDQVPCVVGMGVDISERRHAEEAVRAAQEQLSNYAENLERLVAERTASVEQSIAALEGVLYHVAHDLRAPLRAMRGFTSILLEEYGRHFDAAGQEYARRISEAAGRMDQLIFDLLEYGRLCHTALPLEQVPLGEPIQRALGLLQDDIAAKRADVQVDSRLPLVWANPAALETIISNLLSNSLKFVAPGTRPSVRIRAHEHDGVVRLSVEDRGIGIDPKYQERVFRVFERLHSSEEYPGTGIGLALVQKAAQRLNAKLGLQSNVGQGSTFWIELRKVAPNESGETQRTD